jgi:hypothetical protein
MPGLISPARIGSRYGMAGMWKFTLSLGLVAHTRRLMMPMILFLHVVWQHDREIFRRTHPIPTLVLEDKTPATSSPANHRTYTNAAPIPCAAQFGQVKSHCTKFSTGNALMQRMIKKHLCTAPSLPIICLGVAHPT